MYVTGDIHTDEIKKLNTKNFPKQKLLSKKDYVIIAGDFGLVWDNSKSELYLRNWFEKKHFTTLFIDGNHDNHQLLNNYPIEQWNGGKIHRISPSIIHLMRGQVYTLENKKVFTFGGAESVDIKGTKPLSYMDTYERAILWKGRRKNINWWKEELPSEEEMQEGLKNLKENNWTVDYIITHCSSTSVLNILADIKHQDYNPNILNNYLEIIQEKVNFKHWYFGHHHIDYKDVYKNQTVIYKKIIQI